MTELSFDALATSFDDQRWLPAPALSRLADLIDDLGSGCRLDVIEPGIGTGRIALAALARGYRVTGVDVSMPMLDALRSKLDAHADLGERLTLIHGDARRLPFPAATFTFAILASVLYLIPEWEMALDEAIRVLHPDGALIAVIERSTPSRELARWDAQWRDLIERTGYRHASLCPDDDALIAALAERCSSVDARVLDSWTIGQTVGEARRSLGTLRPLYAPVSAHDWGAATRRFMSLTEHAFPDPAVRLACEVRLEVIVCRGFECVTYTSAGHAPQVGQ